MSYSQMASKIGFFCPLGHNEVKLVENDCVTEAVFYICMNRWICMHILPEIIMITAYVYHVIKFNWITFILNFLTYQNLKKSYSLYEIINILFWNGIIKDNISHPAYHWKKTEIEFKRTIGQFRSSILSANCSGHSLFVQF